MKQLTFLSLIAALALVTGGCSDDVNCVEEPTDPDCVDSCIDDPTLPGCDSVDMGPTDMPEPPVDMGPCGGDCGSQVCDETSGDCVDCLSEAQCEDPTPFCGPDNTCVGCTEHGDCSNPANGQCNNETNTCVPCDDSIQCTEDGAGVCDAGTCVQCSADDETACGDNVCDISEGTCTTTPAGMTGLCQECVSDRQCDDGQVCAPMTFMDSDVGNYCLWRESSGEPGGPDGTCAPGFRPYVAGSEVTSVSGETVRVCGLAITTCAALNDYRVEDSCSTAFMNDPCGVPGVDDGLCRDDPMSGSLGTRCTIPCLGNEDCRGLTCLTTESPAFCDF